MKFLLSLMTFFVSGSAFISLLAFPGQAQAEVMTVRSCSNITNTVTVLQQNVNGVPRIVVQDGSPTSQGYTGCQVDEDGQFLSFNCKGIDKGAERAANIKLKVNKENLGATLTTKVFFTKLAQLACHDVSL